LSNLQTREIRLERRVEPAGTKAVRRGSRGERRERSFTRRECDRWHKETVTSSQPVLPPGELGSSRQSVHLGNSSTESPADVTDDRPS